MIPWETVPGRPNPGLPAFFGTALSYSLDTPSGSTIILFAGALYICGIVVRKVVTGIKKKRERQKVC
jgi:hypothetical protein